MKSKKGFALADLGNYALLFGIAVIVMGLVTTILVQIAGTQCTYGFSATANVCQNSTGGTSGGVMGAAVNTTLFGISGVNSLAGWVPTFVVIVAAVLVLGMVGMLAYRQFRG